MICFEVSLVLKLILFLLFTVWLSYDDYIERFGSRFLRFVLGHTQTFLRFLKERVRWVLRAASDSSFAGFLRYLIVAVRHLSFP